MQLLLAVIAAAKSCAALPEFITRHQTSSRRRCRLPPPARAHRAPQGLQTLVQQQRKVNAARCNSKRLPAPGQQPCRRRRRLRPADRRAAASLLAAAMYRRDFDRRGPPPDFGYNRRGPPPPDFGRGGFDDRRLGPPPPGYGGPPMDMPGPAVRSGVVAVHKEPAIDREKVGDQLTGGCGCRLLPPVCGGRGLAICPPLLCAAPLPAACTCPALAAPHPTACTYTCRPGLPAAAARVPAPGCAPPAGGVWAARRRAQGRGAGVHVDGRHAAVRAGGVGWWWWVMPSLQTVQTLPTGAPFWPRCACCGCGCWGRCGHCTAAVSL